MRPPLGRSALPILFAFLALGCSSSHKGADASKPDATTALTAVGPVPVGSTPEPSPQAALTKLLDAEQRLDHATSYRYVLHGGGQLYTTVNAWAKRRAELPAVIRFTVEPGTGSRASALVEHRPGLDPFVGLSAARERQVWTGVRAGTGWLLQPEADATPELPPDSAAVVVTDAWTAAIQHCDQHAAAKLQGIPILFDSTTETPDLCHVLGPVRTGGVGRLAPGPVSGDIIAQYTTDALYWARVVNVESPRRFAVVVAPFGPSWKVIGIGDHP